VIGSIATVGAVIVAIPIGLTFDGTPTPLAIGVLIACVTALGIMSLLGPTQTE
jgi:DHA1 family bicyclomycin/chloramphenicol resistance-like MFS transporter